jgi:hypothetical protein
VLKREPILTTYGTTEVVPFPKTCSNRSFSACCKAGTENRALIAAVNRCATQKQNAKALAGRLRGIPHLRTKRARMGQRFVVSAEATSRKAREVAHPPHPGLFTRQKKLVNVPSVPGFPPGFSGPRFLPASRYARGG